MGQRHAVRPIGERQAHGFVEEFGASSGCRMPDLPGAANSALAGFPPTPGRPCGHIAGNGGDRVTGLVDGSTLGIRRAGRLQGMAETPDVSGNLTAEPPCRHGDRRLVPATKAPAPLDGPVAVIRQGFAQPAAELGILERATQLGDAPSWHGRAEMICPVARRAAAGHRGRPCGCMLHSSLKTAMAGRLEGNARPSADADLMLMRGFLPSLAVPFWTAGPARVPQNNIKCNI